MKAVAKLVLPVSRNSRYFEMPLISTSGLVTGTLASRTKGSPELGIESLCVFLTSISISLRHNEAYTAYL